MSSRPSTATAPTIRAQLRLLAADHGDRQAVVFGDQVVTYAELERRSLAFASALDAAGLAAGDRVAALLPNSVEWLVA